MSKGNRPKVGPEPRPSPQGDRHHGPCWNPCPLNPVAHCRSLPGAVPMIALLSGLTAWYPHQLWVTAISIRTDARLTTDDNEQTAILAFVAAQNSGNQDL